MKINKTTEKNLIVIVTWAKRDKDELDILGRWAQRLLCVPSYSGNPLTNISMSSDLELQPWTAKRAGFNLGLLN